MFFSIALFDWGSVVTGTAGLINGLFQSGATGRANKRNIQFAKESQQEQERFAKEMFDLENSYNTPSAVQERLAKAGINPAAYWSQSSGSAGMASGESSVSPVTPNILPVPSPLQGMVGSEPFQALKELAQIENIKKDNERRGIENSRLADQIESEIQKNLSETALNNRKNDYQKLVNEGFPKYRAAELRLMENQALKAAADGELAKTQKLVEQWREKAEKWKVEKYNPLLENELNENIKLIEEKQRTEKSSQASNYADAAHSLAVTETENVLRPIRKLSGTIRNGIDGYEFLENSRLFNDRINALLYEYKKMPQVTDAEVKEIEASAEMARKENTWYHWNQFFDKVERVNNGANKWAPWAVSRTDERSHDETVTHYDARGRKTSSTTISRKDSSKGKH